MNRRAFFGAVAAGAAALITGDDALSDEECLAALARTAEALEFDPWPGDPPWAAPLCVELGPQGPIWLMHGEPLDQSKFPVASAEWNPL